MLVRNLKKPRPWVLPSILGFALVTGPKTLQVVAVGYLVHFIFVRLPGLLDEAVPQASAHGSISRLTRKTLKVAAWISAIGLAWLAVTISINLIWPSPVAPDFLWPEGK